ncbi:hypothetical protein TcG_13387 [Trypanosoma cruzi]|nr:hypothetical protein TcG_13387 [Trypanosoma cruzi]
MLTARTSLEPPRLLSSYNWPKVELPVFSRTTVERRWRISSIALRDDFVGQFEISGGASAARCAAYEDWWEVAGWMEPPSSAFMSGVRHPLCRFLMDACIVSNSFSGAHCM